MIDRTFDSSFVNCIINHPSIYPHVALPNQGALDAAGLLANPDNICLATDLGCFILIKLDAGLYEVHTNFLPEGRGEHALMAAADGFTYMFTKTDCMEVVTKVPQANKAAARFADACGFSHEFTSGQWETPKGPTPVDHYAMRYSGWVKKSDIVQKSGEWFHDLLHEQKKRFGKEETSHPDDPVHDRYVGACVETIKAGQVDKAIFLYNRWARFAGYETIRAVASDPLIIDIKDSLLLVSGDKFEVLKCQ